MLYKSHGNILLIVKKVRAIQNDNSIAEPMTRLIALRTRTKNSIIDEMDCGIIHTHITNHIV